MAEYSICENKLAKRFYGLISPLFAGVEHLLRDVKDTTISTLATEVITLPNRAMQY